MGTYGMAGMAGTITGGGASDSGSYRGRTGFPESYVPNCVTNGGLILNRADHVAALMHVRAPGGGVARVTKYFTPGPSGPWGFGTDRRHFHGMESRRPVLLRDFLTWMSRQVPIVFGRGFSLVSPGVCVKTVWHGDGRAPTEAPAYAAPAPAPAPAPDVGAPLDAIIRWRGDSAASGEAPAAPGWHVVGDRPSRAGAAPRLPVDWLSTLRGRGAPAPAPAPGTDLPAGAELPPGMESSGEPGEGLPAEEPTLLGRVSAYASANPVVVVGVLAAVAFVGHLAWKSRKAPVTNRRRRRNGEGPYRVTRVDRPGRPRHFPSLQAAVSWAEYQPRGQEFAIDVTMSRGLRWAPASKAIALGKR